MREMYCRANDHKGSRDPNSRDNYTVSERYSMGIYAGLYCDDCWEKDGRNHNRQFDPMDAGEHYDEDY